MKSKIKLLAVFFVLFGSLATTSFAQKNAGAWKDVCCGPHCDEGDYCTGNGSYDCCK